jgi:hypothetical protein
LYHQPVNRLGIPGADYAPALLLLLPSPESTEVQLLGGFQQRAPKVERTTAGASRRRPLRMLVMGLERTNTDLLGDYGQDDHGGEQY